MSGTRWERIGAAGGLTFVLLALATFLTPSAPEADARAAELQEFFARERTGSLAHVYLSALGGIAFLVFATGVYTRLRRAEAEGGASVFALGAGIAATVLTLVTNGGMLAVVYSADDESGRAGLRALFDAYQAASVTWGFANAAFFGGVALSTLSTRSLPSWLGWTATATALAFLAGLLGIFDEKQPLGGIGVLFFVALLLNLLWVAAASVLLLRRGGRRPPGAPRSR